jgi:hypothetical protein
MPAHRSAVECSCPRARHKRPGCGPVLLTRRQSRRGRRIDRYQDELGVRRELIVRAGSNGSLLVIDRRPSPGCDERLLAHLPADEPFENAVIVCRRYLEDRPTRRGCRPVTEDDKRSAPLSFETDAFHSAWEEARCPEADYRLEQGSGRMTIAQLRWMRYPHGGGGAAGEPVSLREAIGETESYEPLCAVTRAALARHGNDPSVSITILRAELERVLESPIVLNRGLREAVLTHLEREQMSMSEVAIRCGRIKRDRTGNESGETSWLARRLGLLPEGGKRRPTPWIHSDVLGLIAREGIGVSPREVEL